jgi:nucleoside-diphosphate-sugar epimerase
MMGCKQFFLAGQSVFVTGAGGFVGKKLCDSLARHGAAVTACVRDLRLILSSGQASKEFTYREISDITQVSDWSSSLRGMDTVVHLAARAHVLREIEPKPIDRYRAVNTDGTLLLARHAASAGVRRFVFLSSIGVNGNATSVAKPFTEESPIAPHNAYAVSKWEAEEGLFELANETGMEVVIIRPPLVYGPGVKANFLVMMRCLYEGIPLPLGAILNRRSLVALDNLVDLIGCCIEHPAAVNQIFLVADGVDLSTTEILRRLGNCLGKPARLLPIPQKIVVTGLKCIGRRDLAQRLCGSLRVDISKARELLGWTPPVSVHESFLGTAQYFLGSQS